MTQATTQKPQELSVAEVTLVVGGVTRGGAHISPHHSTHGSTGGSTGGMVGTSQIKTGNSRPGC